MQQVVHVQSIQTVVANLFDAVQFGGDSIKVVGVDLQHSKDHSEQKLLSLKTEVHQHVDRLLQCQHALQQGVE